MAKILDITYLTGLLLIGMQMLMALERIYIRSRVLIYKSWNSCVVMMKFKTFIALLRYRILRTTSRSCKIYLKQKRNKFCGSLAAAAQTTLLGRL